MMRSATAFLPDSMTTFMNLDRSTEPNFGSGRISRLGTSRRRGISLPFSSVGLSLALASGATDFWGHPLTRSALGARRKRLDQHCAGTKQLDFLSLLRTLRAVL